MGSIKLGLAIDKLKHLEYGTIGTCILIAICIMFRLYDYHLWIPVLLYSACIVWELYGKVRHDKKFDLEDISIGTSFPMFIYVGFLIVCSFSGLI